MSEYITSYGVFNIYDFVDKYVERVSRVIDERALEKLERELAEYGYVKVVRCRDCEWFTPEYFYEEERGFGVVEILSDPPDCGNPERCSHHYDSLTKKTVPVHIVTDPDGFCAWGKRKEGGE